MASNNSATSPFRSGSMRADSSCNVLCDSSLAVSDAMHALSHASGAPDAVDHKAALANAARSIEAAAQKLADAARALTALGMSLDSQTAAYGTVPLPAPTPSATVSTSRPRPPQRASLAQLPAEILHMISECATLTAMKNLRLVCQEWHDLVTPWFFQRIFLHRCPARQSEFDIFLRLCLRPPGKHIRGIRLCNGACTNGMFGYEVCNRLPREPLVLADESNISYRFNEFLRSIESFEIKAKPNFDERHLHFPDLTTLWEGMVGLRTLSLVDSDLSFFFGPALGHVLYPRLHTLNISQTMSKLRPLMQLLLPHASTLRVVSFERVFLTSHGWRAFFTDLGAKHKGKFHLDSFFIVVGKTPMFNHDKLWQDLVLGAFGDGRIEPSYTKPPQRVYVNGFAWNKAAVKSIVEAG